MAIELLTPFTKVELEPEIKEKKRKQVGILGGILTLFTMPISSLRIKCASSWDWTKFYLCLNTNLLMLIKRKPSLSTIVSRCLNWRLRGLKA